MKDPKLMAWLHEPQLMQRDEKQIEGYTLQAQLNSPCSIIHLIITHCVALVCIFHSVHGKVCSVMCEYH